MTASPEDVNPLVAIANELRACVTASGGIDLRDPSLLHEAADALCDAAAELSRLSRLVEDAGEENKSLKASVIAFCAPWAVTYARDHGYPPGHLHPGHYDLLKHCGARMVDFTRAAQAHKAIKEGGE